VTVPKAHGAPPIVVISTTNDPATPYEEGVALAKELESGRLLIHRGEGHAVYVLGGDQCIDSAVNDYLLNLNAPASGTSCGNGAPPPGPPNTGTGQSSGTARVAAIMLAFVVVAAAIAGMVVGLQRSRNSE
jgi:hypothetical protein